MKGLEASRGFKRWKSEQRRLNREARSFNIPIRQRIRSLMRTTAFRLILGALAVFICFSLLQFRWLQSDAEAIITEQIQEAMNGQMEGLKSQYRRNGLLRVIESIDNRIARGSPALYLVVNPEQETITGNMTDLAPRAFRGNGPVETRFRLAKDEARKRRYGLVKSFVTDEGYRIFVGHDLADRGQIKSAFQRSARLSITLTVLLGIAGAIAVARLVLRRIDVMSYKAYTIMNGDLASRLPVSNRDDELDRLALSLNAMLERIEALMSGLKQVSDNVAHDLKTPLTRLRNRADDALRRAKGDEEHKAALEKVIEESDSLIRVFNSMLLIARAEAGKMPQAVAPIDLMQVVADVAELYEASIEEAGGTLAVENLDKAMANGNRELVGQAIANLLDNAMKYGREEGGPLAIRLRLAEEGRNFAISVADQGPGIPPEECRHVFERFVRLEKSRSVDGFGIGLSLVQAVAKLHGGAVRIDEREKGLTITLLLPKIED